MTANKYELVNVTTGKKAVLETKSGTLGPDCLNIANITRDHGAFTFDPGFMATAACESRITYIDGDAGVLLHRGYPIEQLAAKSSFLEVAYLLMNGDLPTVTQLEQYDRSIRYHTMLNETLLRFFNGFHYDAHPMAMVSAVVASMAAFYHDSMDIHNPRHREIFAHRIIAKMPTISAAAYKHMLGQPFVYPRNDLDYCANLLHMFFSVPAEEYVIDPIAAQAIDLLFILHADHEQNASTSTVRLAGSTGANPYAAISAGVSALWGPAHGGANEAVLVMLEDIGTVDNIPKFLDRVKDKQDPREDHPRDVPPRAAAARPQRQPAVRAGTQARGDRAQGRVLHRAQALPERRFLFRHHLQRARHPTLDVHRVVRDGAHGRLGRALDGDDLGSCDEDRPAAPALHGAGATRLRGRREPPLIRASRAGAE